MRTFTLIAALAAASPALADVEVTFRDGAPKDRFTITNIGGCPLGGSDVVINLEGSPSGLIFDITGDGAGVEVFQPFELVTGADLVLTASDVADGDTTLVLSLAPMTTGDSVVFTIDLDDTVGTREITVSGSEIAGADVTLIPADLGPALTAVFDDTGRAVVTVPACVS